ncbi:helix-turn-helix domain-containing protein [Paractinoplanes rishiriensis]|uniref:XRE family transcriptional regulator n=1 Tax=Paractinoplanes rishiriensis TaxID=1050105 RepID=A0A919JVM3_9ACTN|nr:helix-turn-helix domain-containing protein [Actinoplanes rishiriensis]GIE94137.1 XRE family transcriptional regulator [Actinoplanes rishiriensis]
MAATAPAALAAKINHLFDTIRRADGSRYSNDEVAAAMGGDGPSISGSYLWLLRRGERDNPTKKHLEALAQFFDVSPAYFFDEAESSAIAGELALLRALADAGVQRVATRLGGLSAASLRDIANVIERFRASEGLDARYAKDDG